MGTTESPSPVTLYTTPGCPDCRAVKAWLHEHGVAFQEKDVSDPEVADEARQRYGIRVAPITVIGDEVLYGTFDDQRTRLQALLGER